MERLKDWLIKMICCPEAPELAWAMQQLAVNNCLRVIPTDDKEPAFTACVSKPEAYYHLAPASHPTCAALFMLVLQQKVMFKMATRNGQPELVFLVTEGGRKAYGPLM
jgi:hypothetical protein